MQISTEGKIGIWLGLIALGGGGAIMVAPQHIEIGWTLIDIALVGAVMLVSHHVSNSLQIKPECRMIPLVGMIVFGLSFVGCAAWYFWPASQTTVVPTQTTASGPVPVLGSLQYVVFTAHVTRKNSTKQTSVQMMVEVRNANNYLVQYHVHMRGNVNDKSPSPTDTEFDGYIGANETRQLMYSRIDDVPANEHPDINKPVLWGILDYDVTYWAAENSSGVKRQTSKTCRFEMTRPFSKDMKPNEYKETRLDTVIKLSNEIEK
jgi:hypothetical protein